jgi:hypothetical protein
VRLEIRDFEFCDNKEWDVTVPPNLMPIEQDDTIKALLQYRLVLSVKMNLLEKMKPDSKEESKISANPILPFSVFSR